MKLNNNDDSHNSGLNLLIYNMLLDIESHPAWVCGLKHGNAGGGTGWEWSHPAWVCGLKLCCKRFSVIQILVTPCVGVWIETQKQTHVARYQLSHPAWVCGLKQLRCTNV